VVFVHVYEITGKGEMGEFSEELVDLGAPVDKQSMGAGETRREANDDTIPVSHVPPMCESG